MEVVTSEDGAEFFKRGISRMKLAERSDKKGGVAGVSGIESVSLYTQSVQLLDFALASGKYDGAALKKAVEAKRSVAVARLEVLKRELPADNTAEGERTGGQALRDWMSSRAGDSGGLTAKSGGGKAAVGGLELAVAVLKKAASAEALGSRGAADKRAEALQLYKDGAAQLLSLTKSGKSEKVRAALDKKYAAVAVKIAKLEEATADAAGELPPTSKSTPNPAPAAEPAAGSAPEPVPGPEPGPALALASSSLATASPAAWQLQIDRSLPPDLGTMRPFQLKQELKKRRLPSEGSTEQLLGRLRDFGAGKISPEPTSEQLAQSLVGSTVRAVKAPALKVSADEKSKRCGNLKKGEEVVVLQANVMAGGAIRLRCEQGWISMKSKTGNVLVEHVEPGAKVRTGGGTLQPDWAVQHVANQTLASTSAAKENAFRRSLPLLKAAAALDAKVERGHLDSAARAAKLYREAIALLEQACASAEFSEKVKASMATRMQAANDSLTKLERITNGQPEPEPEPEPQPERNSCPEGVPPNPAVQAESKAYSAATNSSGTIDAMEIFKQSVGILKQAAALDAKALRGDRDAAPEAFRLYSAGSKNLRTALAAPSCSDKLRVALENKLSSVMKRLDTLKSLAGASVAVDTEAGTGSRTGVGTPVGATALCLVGEMMCEPETDGHTEDAQKRRGMSAGTVESGTGASHTTKGQLQSVSPAEVVDVSKEDYEQAAKWSNAEAERAAIRQQAQTAREQVALKTKSAVAAKLEEEAARRQARARQQREAAQARTEALQAVEQARQETMASRNVERRECLQQKERAAAEQRAKRKAEIEDMDAQMGSIEFVEDLSGEKCRGIIQELVPALRDAMNAANRVRPADPQRFIAASLNGARSQFSDASEPMPRVDALAFVELYNAQLNAALVRCCLESDGAKPSRKLAEFLIAEP